MARGKGGLSSNVVLVTTRRRAASVPAALSKPITLSEYSSHAPASFRRSQRIAHDLDYDSGNIRAASRRQDQRLLDSVNTTLASGAFAQPVVLRRRRSLSARPPSAPPKQAPTGGCARRVAAVRRRQVEDEDEYEFPEFRLPRPAVSHRYRSMSVPPTPVVVSTGFIDKKSPLLTVANDFRASSYTSPTVRPYVPRVDIPPRPAYYGGPTVVKRDYYPSTYIPERPSYVASSYRSRAASEPPKRQNSLMADQAVRRAREALGRVEREVGSYASPGGFDDVDLDDYYDEPIVRAAPIVPVRSTAPTGFIRGSIPVVTRRRSGGHAPAVTQVYSYSTKPQSERLAEIEARIQAQSMVHPEHMPYSQLRTKAQAAKSKIDTHKTLMDRYLPIYMGPENEVQNEVLYKYGQLESRMPSLQPRPKARDTGPRASSVPPYRPPSAPARPAADKYGGALRIQPFKPTMSDTRRKCREVLCKTKRDPHYFDY